MQNKKKLLQNTNYIKKAIMQNCFDAFGFKLVLKIVQVSRCVNIEQATACVIYVYYDDKNI